MGKLATATMAYSMNNDCGGIYGATNTFYADANLNPDDIDAGEAPHISSTVVTDKSDDAEADQS